MSNPNSLFLRQMRGFRYGLSGFALCLPLWVGAVNIDNLLPQCFECHGKNGESQRSDVPIIAGLNEKTLSQALHAYQQGKRTVAAEQHLRLSGSDQRIEALARHFAQQTFVPSQHRSESEPARVERGLLLHLDYCEKCHSENGSNDQLGNGILAGQQQNYLRSSLNAFYSGQRPMPENKAKRLEALLEEQELDALEDLLAFYAYQGQQLTTPMKEKEEEPVSQ